MFKKLKKKTPQEKSTRITRGINWAIVSGILLVSLVFGPKIYNVAKDNLPQAVEVMVEIPADQVPIDPNLPIQNSNSRLCTDYLDAIKTLEEGVTAQLEDYYDGNIGIGRLEMEMYVLAKELMCVSVPDKGSRLYNILEGKIEGLRDYSATALENITGLTEEEREMELPLVEETIRAMVAKYEAAYEEAIKGLLDDYNIPYTETEYGIGYKKVTY